MDYITEIDVSKCNQFMASVGNDANLILWDLRRGKVVRKLTDHTALINKVVFFTPKKETDIPMNTGGSPSSLGNASREMAFKTKIPAYTAATCS